MEVRCRFINTDGQAGDWFSSSITTADAGIEYEEVANTPGSLADINPTEGGKLGGIQPGATVGGTIGTNIRNPDGSIFVPSEGGGEPILDTTPPAIPTGLALASTLTDTGVDLNVTWTAPTDEDLAGYDIAVREGSGTWIEYKTSSPAFTRNGLKRNTAYSARVRAFDKLGNASAWSSIVSHTTTRDLVAPAVPINLSVSAAYNTANIIWLNPADADLKSVSIVLYNNAEVAIDSRLIAASPSGAGSVIWTNLTKATTYKVRAQAIDTSGNLSAFTSYVSFTTAGGIAAGDFTPGLSPIQTVSSLPAAAGYTGPTLVFLQTDGKLYRYASGAWSKSVDGQDVLAGTIQAAQVATGALTARTLAVGNPDNVVPDGDFRDRAWWNSNVFDGRLDVVDIAFPTFKRALAIAPGGGIDVFSTYFPVEPGATYRITTSVYTSTDFSGVFRPTIHMPGHAWWATKSGMGIDPSTTDPTHNYTTANTSWHDVSYNYTNPSIADCRQWQFRIMGGFTGAAYFAVKIVRVSDTTLIKDGAVTTDKIVVNTLEGDRIKVGTLDASKITAGTISTDRLTLGVRSQVINNLLNTSFWGSGDMAAQPYWSPNHAPSNSWYIGASPMGGAEPMLRMAAVTNAANGGWNVTLRPEDGWSKDKAYRYYTWVHIESGDNSIYHGCDYVQHLSGGDADNPYFFAFGKLNGLTPPGNWYLMVGNIHPANSLMADSGMSGVYNPVTGQRIIAGNDYRWRPNATVGAFRSYQYYGNTGGVAFFTKPVVEEVVAGQTPSIKSLFQGLDYAQNINTGSTQILPGMVNISGGTTLSSWRQGGDDTKIAGGSISANTIDANKLRVGMRGIKVAGVDFQYNRDNGRLYWTDGHIFFMDDANNPAAPYVPANSQPWGGGSINYFYWSKITGQIHQGVDNWAAIMADTNLVIFVTWYGGASFLANYGGTIIDGDRITTGSVNADRLRANTVIANTVQVGGYGALSGIASNASTGAADPAQRINAGVTTINGGKITTGTVTAAQLNVTSLSAVSGTIGLLRTSTTGQRTEVSDAGVQVFDAAGNVRVRLGVF